MRTICPICCKGCNRWGCFAALSRHKAAPTSAPQSLNLWERPCRGAGPAGMGRKAAPLHLFLAFDLSQRLARLHLLQQRRALIRLIATARRD